jgi:hypothetical protein
MAWAVAMGETAGWLILEWPAVLEQAAGIQMLLELVVLLEQAVEWSEVVRAVEWSAAVTALLELAADWSAAESVRLVALLEWVAVLSEQLAVAVEWSEQLAVLLEQVMEWSEALWAVVWSAAVVLLELVAAVAAVLSELLVAAAVLSELLAAVAAVLSELFSTDLFASNSHNGTKAVPLAPHTAGTNKPTRRRMRGNTEKALMSSQTNKRKSGFCFASNHDQRGCPRQQSFKGGALFKWGRILVCSLKTSANQLCIQWNVHRR